MSSFYTVELEYCLVHHYQFNAFSFFSFAKLQDAQK